MAELNDDDRRLLELVALDGLSVADAHEAGLKPAIGGSGCTAAGPTEYRDFTHLIPEAIP